MKKRILTAVLVVLFLVVWAVVPVSSAEEGAPKFSFQLELYDADALPKDGAMPGAAKPLDPLKLKVGQRVVAAVRYSGLDAMEGNGVQCLAVSFSYDESRFELLEFDGEAGETALWTDSGKQASSQWLPEALKGSGYTASASDRATEQEGIRRVYVQYIAEENQNAEVLRETEGYVGAFTMRVKQAIAESEGITLGWADYAVGLYQSGAEVSAANFSRAVLQADDRFLAPEDVPVAAAEEVGVTVSGSIYSYNRYNDITVELYAMSDIEAAMASDPENGFATTAVEAAYEVVVDGDPIPTGEERSSVQAEKTFEIPSVVTGDYQLRIIKGSHITAYINNVHVGDADYTLADPVTLIAGDINGNGSIDGDDLNMVTARGTWFAENLSSNMPADLNGDGSVDGDDLNMVTARGTWFTEAAVVDLDEK